MPPRKKGNLPTIKERKFVAEYLRTGSPQKAQIKAYNTPKSYAAKVAYNVLKRPPVQKLLRECMEEEGLTNESIAVHMNKILDASTSDRALGKATVKDGISIIREINKIKDAYPAERKEIRQQTVKLNLQGKSPQEIEDTLSVLMEETRQFKHMVEKENEQKRLREAEKKKAIEGEIVKEEDK